MARILRRRVVQAPKVASGRRNLASEINQWLKLGLNAQQIIEKMIPDDPSVTPEMMDPVFDMMARRQGATAPLAQRAAGVQQVAGSMLGQTPAIPVGQPPSEVPKPPSLGLGAPPAPSPGAAVPQQYLRPPPMDASVTGVPMAKVVSPEDMESTPTRANRESLIAQAVQSGDTQEQAAEWADSMLRSEAEALATRDAATEAERAQAKSQAKAEVSQSIQEAQIAENAEQLKSSFRQMFNAIKEGSGMYDFADNVQRAVPLFLRAAQASKASSDDIQLFKLFAQKIIREQEATAKGKEADRLAKERREENNRRFKRAQDWWREQRTALTAEKLAGLNESIRRDVFKAILAAKDGEFSTPVKRAIEGQIKTRKVYRGELAALEKIKGGFPGGEEGLNEAIKASREQGRVPSKYAAAWPLYETTIVNLARAKGEMDAQEEIIQEYAASTGNFIPPLAPLGAKASSGKGVDPKPKPKPEQGSAVVNKARRALLGHLGMPEERVDSILGRRNYSTKEASSIAGDQFKRK